MSKVTDLFTEHSIENAELLASVEQIVKAAELKNTGGIPKARLNEVIDQRNELRADVEELNGTIKTLNGKLETANGKIKDSKGLQDELDTYKKQVFDKSKSIWLEKAAMFDIEEDDKNFDKITKIKGDFTFKEKPEEYTEAEIAQNILMLKPYEKIGYFGDTYKAPEIDESRGKGDKTDKSKVKDPYAVFDKK